MVVLQRELDRSVQRFLQRLLLGLGLLATALCLLFALTSWRQQSSLRTVFDDRVLPLHQLQQIQQALNVELPTQLAASQPDWRAVASTVAGVRNLWQAYLGTYLTEEEQALMRQVQTLLDAQLAAARGGTEAYGPRLQAMNAALAPLLALQVRVAQEELRGAAQWSRVGLGLALAALGGGWLLVLLARRRIREQVVWPIRVVADAIADLAAPEPALGPEAEALRGDFAEVGRQLQQLRAALAERQALQQRTAALLEQLQGAQAELVEVEKLASLGRLVAGVAHELNTPLGVAVAVSSGLGDRTRSFRAELEAGALRRSQLDGLLHDLEAAAELLDRNLARAADLLRSFKQVAVDRSGMQRRRFDLAATVTEVFASLRPLYGRQGANLVNELPAGLWMDGYPGAFGQVLSNLVGNAVLHGFQGRPGRVRVSLLDEDAQRVRVQIEDDGVGMSPEVRARAFEPFFTTRLGQGGSGLGLSIVRNLVVGVLGGRIELQTAPGAGCRFLLRLPRSAPLPQEEQAP